MYFAFKDWFKLLVIEKNHEENLFKTKKYSPLSIQMFDS